MGSLRYVCLGVLFLIGYSAFSACSFTVDLDYLQDRHCPSTEKLCNDKCVSKSDPRTGCGGEACVPCTLSQATANCNNGLCAVAGCLRSYRDCNRVADDGCEIDIDHDPAHCGSCTAVPCVVANAAPDCAAGRCAIRLCNSGWGDCNDMATPDGCEINLLTSSEHCSKCNAPCASGTTCVGGTCR